MVKNYALNVERKMDNRRFLFFVLISVFLHISLLLINFYNVFAKNESNRFKIVVLNYQEKETKNLKKQKIFEKKFQEKHDIIQKEEGSEILINSQTAISESLTFSQTDEVLEFDFNDVRAPKIFNFNPSYPSTLKKMAKTGSVEIKICVDSDGNMCGYEIISSSNKKFEESVLEALKKAYFEPALIDGKKIKSYGRLKVRFELEDR